MIDTDRDTNNTRQRNDVQLEEKRFSKIINFRKQDITEKV